MADNIREQMSDREKWYGDAANYWKEVSADLEGMLGGYQSISPIDIQASKQFLKEIKKKNLWTSGSKRALDCGAGIGRVSKHLLSSEFELVDLLEQNSQFLGKVNTYMADKANKVGELIPLGLQDFTPRNASYDVIWFQWVVGHLTDEDFVSCLKRFRHGLKPGGCICIKDNVAGGEAVFDAADSSVTRTHEQYMKIFQSAGMKVKLKKTQTNFPRELYKVNMYALS